MIDFVTKFYQHSTAQRRALLIAQGYLPAQAEDLWAPFTQLPLLNDISALSENQIGTMALPFGVAYPVYINQQAYALPMVTEETSIVAALCKAARRLDPHHPMHATQPTEHRPAEYRPAEYRPAEHQPAEHQPAEHQPAEHQPTEHQPTEHQPAECQPTPAQALSQDQASPHQAAQPGQLVTASTKTQWVWGQIELYQLSHPQALAEWWPTQFEALKKIADRFLPSLVARGGGLRQMHVRVLSPTTAVLMLALDACEAMGANYVTQLAEHLRQPVQQAIRQGCTTCPAQPDAKVGAAIVSNYATESLTTASLTLPMAASAGQSIVRLQRWAEHDVYRATTHNKGIFNAVDAIVLATGNDTRAVSASGHAYAARSGHYQPLTTWDYSAGELQGQLTLPLNLGTVGGAIKVNPCSQMALALMQHPNQATLQGLVTAAGLLQNFAALDALAHQGIVQGHMRLQISNLIAELAAPAALIDPLQQQLAEHLAQTGRVNATDAQSIYARLKRAHEAADD